MTSYIVYFTWEIQVGAVCLTLPSLQSNVGVSIARPEA